jgi:transposase
MDRILERCAGLDVHKKSVVACVLTPAGSQVRSFGTMTEDLLSLVDWLLALEICEIAMESTGVYWKPVYNLLEAAELRPIVCNAKDMRNVPGRKTDVKDAEWIAQLHQYGLLKASFIPDRDSRELRELVRYRKSVIRERSSEANRIQKVLEGANIKLASVASDVLGRSGREMLSALAAGNEDVEALAGMARGRLASKGKELERALRGVVGRHQRFILAEQLRHIEELDSRVLRLDEEIAQRLHPFGEQLAALETIPGVGRRVAQSLVVEIGVDMSRFPTAKHLASWAKLCPGNNESAGKRRSGRTGRGNNWLKTSMTEAAWAAARSKNNFLRSQFNHWARRLGTKRAIVAMAHSILTIVYHILKDRQPYQDLGPDFLDQRRREAIRRNAERRLLALEFDVQITDRRAA